MRTATVRGLVVSAAGLGLMLTAAAARAQEAAAPTSAAHADLAAAAGTGGHAGGESAGTPELGPVLPEDASWAKTVVAGIGILFAAAAVVGPIVRRDLPEEVPPAHSHDEPPGASGHHGRSGTVNPHGH
jgi:hypothetical protein